jgi:Flp pilus assembly protein TadG
MAEGDLPAMQAHEHGRAGGRRARGDDGAALVEFAIVVPIFFLLVFGIMEFGWAFYQSLDVRHGAREGARLASVNYKTTASPTPADQATQIVDELCSRMDAGDADIDVQITRTGGAIGDELVVTVSKDLEQLTGFLGFVLDGKTIDEQVHSRIEQPATWASMGTAQACP